MANKAEGRAELEFLPAALEVESTPPSPVGRAITWAIVAFVTLGVVWASLGELDVVAVARGKLVPTARVKVIQPMELATVKAIHVAEGTQVAAGDPLIELDATLSQADLERARAELLATRLEAVRLRALLSATEAAAGATPPEPPWPDTASASQRLQQRLLFLSELDEYRARIATAAAEIRRARAERLTARHEIQRIEATLPLVTERAEAIGALAERQLAAHHQYLELEQQRREQAGQKTTLEARLQELEAAIAQYEGQRAALRSQFRRERLAALAEAEQRIAALSEELQKAQLRAAWQTLRAPIAGRVHQLAVHTVGGVVEPAQELMRIVPLEGGLEVEAMLPNKDVAFVHPGQQATVKLDTLPFTRYGTVEATVRKISGDAVADEQIGLVFPLHAELALARIAVGGREFQLAPGMAVALEVATGKRRVIEYLLDPVLKGLDEALEER